MKADRREEGEVHGRDEEEREVELHRQVLSVTQS